MRGTLMLSLLLACGGSHTTTADRRSGADQEGHMRADAAKLSEDPEARFGPLEVGADYLTYRKVTDKPFQSLDHGNRWVDVYVNSIGAAAYLSGEAVPIGTIVVKTSWQDDHGRPSSVAGPLFIMEKRAPGYAPEHGDWYFAIHWADPPPADTRKFGGPIYWRGKSQRAAYCWECHDLYDRRLGGLVPSSQLPR
jgi:Cytochrome P460